jgi:hypothetical protein
LYDALCIGRIGWDGKAELVDLAINAPEAGFMMLSIQSMADFRAA